MTDLKKHIIVKVDNVHWSINGSIRKRLDNQTQNTDYYYFNASGNLKACGTDMQISVYGYNSANIRTYKVNLFNANQWVNGQPQPIQPMVQSAMFYPNTYINFTQAGEYTKHYYNGTERIASRLGEQQVPISVENEQELEAYKQDVKQIIYNAIGQHLYDAPTDMQEGDLIPLEFLQATGDNNAIFYYHPNHLSSTMYVTDAQQSVVQSFLYAPYGDIISEYNTHAMGDAFPKYAFNAKELDEETGMYYYEARYYAPPTFTSRDPLFEKYFWISPYAYCANNPVKYVDPSGKEMWQPEITENGEVSYVAEKGDSKKSFQKQYNISKEATDKIFENAGVTKVKKGTRIAGDAVAKSVTNKTGRKYDDVLKLDWQKATDKQKVYHVMFSLLCDKVRGGYNTNMNQFIHNLPENTGSTSCMKIYGLTQIPLLNGDKMNITVYDASFSQKHPFLDINYGSYGDYSNYYYGDQYKVQYIQPTPPGGIGIQRLHVSWRAKDDKRFKNSYF